MSEGSSIGRGRSWIHSSCNRELSQPCGELWSWGSCMIYTKKRQEDWTVVSLSRNRNLMCVCPGKRIKLILFSEGHFWARPKLWPVSQGSDFLILKRNYGQSTWAFVIVHLLYYLDASKLSVLTTSGHAQRLQLLFFLRKLTGRCSVTQTIALVNAAVLKTATVIHHLPLLRPMRGFLLLH